MTFRPQEFRAIIINDEPKIFNIFLKKFLLQFKDNAESVYIIRVISQVGAILKDHNQSPIIKFKTIKIIMYLLIMAQPKIYEMFQDQIYPLLRNACLYNRSHPLTTRGTEFFKNNKYYSIATHQQKIKIKSLGCKFIAFCLECIFTLASWLGKEPKDKIKQSNFSINYKKLLKENVIFPEIHEFCFFTEDRITQIEKDVKKCQEQIQNFNTDSDYFTSLKSKSDAQMMNGVQFLQQKLKQKQRLISQLKYQHSINDLNKQSIIQKQKEQENVFLDKIMGYQQKITNLTQQVREYKYLIKNYDRQELDRKQRKIDELQALVQKLSAQNKILKQQFQHKSKISFVSNSSVQQFDLKISKQRNFNQKNKQFKILLQMENEAKEFQSTKHSPQKQQFFEYRDVNDSLYPFYDSLCKEQQIRFKKSLLKSKQILHKTKQLEVGTYSLLKNQIQIDLTIIITNLHDKIMYVLDNSFDHPRQTQIFRQQSILNKKKLKPNEQYKEILKITINDIDSRCIMMVMEYHYQGSSVQKLVLILPVTKIKLIKPLSYTSRPTKNWISLERLINIQRKILSSIQKIKEYFSKCFVEIQKTGTIYHLKFQFLQNIFFLSFNLVGEESLRFNMSFNQTHRCLAQKIINEFIFVLGK